MTAELPDDLLPIAEAAEKIGRSPVTVRDWVRERQKKGSKFGVQGYRRGRKFLYVSLREVIERDKPQPIESEVGKGDNTQDSADVR